MFQWKLTQEQLQESNERAEDSSTLEVMETTRYPYNTTDANIILYQTFRYFNNWLLLLWEGCQLITTTFKYQSEREGFAEGFDRVEASHGKAQKCMFRQ